MVHFAFGNVMNNRLAILTDLPIIAGSSPFRYGWEKKVILMKKEKEENTKVHPMTPQIPSES